MRSTNDVLDSLLIEHAKLTAAEIAADVRRVDTTTWTSAAHLSLIVAVEDQWDLELSGEEMAAVQSVSALHRVVASHVQRLTEAAARE